VDRPGITSLACVFRPSGDGLKSPEANLDEAKGQCEKLAMACLDAVTPAINKLFPDAYPGNVFKNQDRQGDLLKAIA
jgi:hypothetical protein